MADKPDLLTEALTSDAATNIASGTEALFRGLMPKGTFNALEVGLGGAKQEDIDARKEAMGGTGEAVEFGAQMMRDAGALALAGPMSLFGMGVLNTVGQTAQEAVNHSPDLTVEHIAGTLFDQMLNAEVGTAVGAALPMVPGVVSATGRVLMGGAKRVIGKMIGKASTLEAPALEAATKEAVETGVLSKARETARTEVAAKKAAILKGIDDFIAPAEIQANEFPAETLLPSSQAWLKQAKPLADKFELVTGKTLSPLTPKKVLEFEGMVESLAKDAAKAGQSTEANALTALKQKVTKLSDPYFADNGIAPPELRTMLQNVATQDAVSAAIPKDFVPMVAEGAKKYAVKAALAGAAHEVAQFVGIPPAWSATGLAAGAAYMGLQKGGRAAMSELAAPLKASAAQGAYNVGRAFSEFDKGVVSQFFANRTGNELGQTVKNAMAGAATETSARYLDDVRLANLQTMAAHPEAFQQQAIQAIDGLPIPEDQKPQVLNVMAQGLTEAKSGLPPVNPMAPPGARVISEQKQMEIERKVGAITDHRSVVHNPTPEGLDALRKVRPSTYNTIIQQALQGAGPNVQPGTPARRLLDALGVDRSIRNAGRAAQGLYATPPMSAPGRPQNTQKTQIDFKLTDSYSTGIDRAEKGTP